MTRRAVLGVGAMLLFLPVGSFGCGGGVASSITEFAEIYGKLATTLERVNDAGSAQTARREITAMTPDIRAAGEALARTVGRGRSNPDVPLEVMMTCAVQQERLGTQLKRLQGEEELWPILQPALQETMILNAMPPR